MIFIPSSLGVHAVLGECVEVSVAGRRPDVGTLKHEVVPSLEQPGEGQSFVPDFRLDGLLVYVRGDIYSLDASIMESAGELFERVNTDPDTLFVVGRRRTAGSLASCNSHHSHRERR
ncbi:MAG: hypothetical protein IH897_09610 [Planctomycetes bacterium]|nr:hypothetical protein [Planctomycetota bacterium]